LKNFKASTAVPKAQRFFIWKGQNLMKLPNYQSNRAPCTSSRCYRYSLFFAAIYKSLENEVQAICYFFTIMFVKHQRSTVRHLKSKALI